MVALAEVEMANVVVEMAVETTKAALLLVEVAMVEVNEVEVGTVQAKELDKRACSDSGEAEMAVKVTRAK